MADIIIEKAREKMNKTLELFTRDLTTIRTGRASSTILERISIDYYGFMTPIAQIAQISVVDSRQIVVRPYEVDQVKAIDKAIRDAQLSLSPVIDGDIVRINVPALTEDRRKEIVKYLNKISEDCKISLRNVRRDANDMLKKDKSISEDQRKRWEKQIQELTDEFVKKVEQAQSAKEKEILTL